FINSAHRHRSAVDVTFDLRNWQDWSDRNITQAVGKISAQMAPFRRFPRPILSSLHEGLPTLFDSVQADGLTLIFHGYAANKISRKEMEQLLEIVERVYEGLPDRKAFEINVGFDFAILDNELRKPVFDELFDLLVDKTIIVQKQEFDADGKPVPSAVVEVERDTVRIIKRILLFLERDTSDTKKGLRFRMEQGLFQGEQRRRVLRSIIPVLPPTAHEFVQTAVKEKRVADQRKTFSQFEDDVVYFNDNFGGIGFWPVPKQNDPETPDLTDIVMASFHPSPVPPLLAGFETQFEATCNWACPSRAYIALFAMLLFALTSLVTWRSYYNGFVADFGFRVLAFGFVGFGNAVILAALLVLTNCDRASTMPKSLLYAFAAALAILILGHLIQRARRGPDP
ncbi:MAG: hypothetical protein OXD48_07230, partial [Litoreibacter sp.]|nr:hypothetical protein [Litoreibacter sp.]